MIKYLELTAPESSAFRQVKILSIECKEGDQIKKGDSLFKVLSGSNKIDLPASMDGRIVEIIATVEENITLSTPLLLLETEVEGSTASKPIIDNDSASGERTKITKKKKKRVAKKKVKSKKVAKKTKASAKKDATKKHEQQSLDLLGDPIKQQTASERPTRKDQPAIENEATDAAAPPLSNTQTVTNTAASKPMSTGANTQISVPDIGSDTAKVIEILVQVGDTVTVEDPLVTLESDKASMDVPSTHDGVISSISVSIDQEVSEGTLILELETTGTDQSSSEAKIETPPAASEVQAVAAKPDVTASQANVAKPVNMPSAPAAAAIPVTGGSSHASPSIRRFARELGVKLAEVTGSGRKSRITKDDVKAYVKNAMTTGNIAASSAASTGIEPVPAQDFSKFGEIDIQPLNKIKRLTASNLHRSWLNVPHVTHNDESNITDLESFRKELNAKYAQQKREIKLSPLAFVVKAVVSAMQHYPQFNSSLEPGGENLIYKKYINIGIAVETPNGLVVPVLKNADTLSVAEIATKMGELAKKARDRKLTMSDMSGGCITISSLGGIGGTHFTPIVNAPEVAILGVSRSKIQPIWNGSEFAPGMILPLSLSYDHRVIDGAEAARFTRHIAAALEDVRLLAV